MKKNILILLSIIYIYNSCNAAQPAAAQIRPASSENIAQRLTNQLEENRKTLSQAIPTNRSIRNKAWTQLYLQSLATGKQATTQDLIDEDKSGHTEKLVLLKRKINEIENEMTTKGIPIPKSNLVFGPIASVIRRQE